MSTETRRNIILTFLTGDPNLPKGDTPTADELRAKPPYLKFAFVNPYNLSLFTGAIAAAALTLNPILGVAALGAEALWLLHAPGSRTLQRVAWNKKLEALCVALEKRELEAKIAALGGNEQKRVNALLGAKQKIDQLAAQNPSFAGDLLRDELVKCDTLVRSFIDIAATCARYDRYLRSVDPKDLEDERHTWETRLRNAKDESASSIAKKNLDVILKRTEKIRDIRKYLDIARGQLDLVENTFHLIADQIVTMQSPRELSGQLDDLLSGVEAVHEATIHTEQLIA
ncbi:MAG TPA: hypothetical protein VGK31_00745 [Thermoanaerobaculia bacterium]